MADLNGFDASTVEPTSDFEPLPAGEYLAMAIDSEFKPTRNGNGEYLQFAFEVVDGQFRGRRLWDRMNLKNSNETTVKIAQAQLSALCRAAGVMRPRDSSELHNKPIRIKVTLEERNDKPGVYKNEIKGYASASSNEAPQPQTQPGAQAQSQASLPPWKRKAS